MGVGGPLHIFKGTYKGTFSDEHVVPWTSVNNDIIKLSPPQKHLYRCPEAILASLQPLLKRCISLQSNLMINLSSAPTMSCGVGIPYTSLRCHRVKAELNPEQDASLSQVAK